MQQLAERARREEILQQYNTRMSELLAAPEEREDWQREITLSEVSAAEVADERGDAVTR